MDEILEVLRQCRVFFVATAEEGQPRVRPFGAHLYRDGKLWFCTGKEKKVYRQLQENPRLEISCYGEGIWLRLSGEAVFEENSEMKKAMLANAPQKARMFYKMPAPAQKALIKKVPGLANMVTAGKKYEDCTAVFYLKNMEAKIYSLTKETKDLTEDING